MALPGPSKTIIVEPVPGPIYTEPEPVEPPAPKKPDEVPA